MTRAALLLASLLALSACNAAFGGPPLVSGKSPAAPLANNSEPEPVNSLPPGAAGLPSGPLATAPNDASITLGTRR